MTWVAVTFFGLMLLGMPVGYVLGIAGVVGMVSIGDLTKSIISQQSFIIEQLEQYIRG